MAILTETIVVEHIEKDHVGCSKLEKWSNTNTFGLTVFMLPTPECTAESTSNCLWGLITTSKPWSNFAQFQLTEWLIGWKESKENRFLFNLLAYEFSNFEEIIRKMWRRTHTAIGYVIFFSFWMQNISNYYFSFGRIFWVIFDFATYVFRNNELDRMAHAFLGYTQLDNHQNPFFSTFRWNVLIDKLRKTETFWLTNVWAMIAPHFFHDFLTYCWTRDVLIVICRSSTLNLKLRLCSIYKFCSFL